MLRWLSDVVARSSTTSNEYQAKSLEVLNANLRKDGGHNN